MRKLILYMAVSVDGYIARTDGKVDWLDDPDFMMEGEDFGYHEFYASIDTTMMGNSTYQEVLGFGVPFPYPDKNNYVFTRSTLNDNEYVSFIKSDIPTFVEKLKGQKGRDIWLVGGGQINTLMIDHGLIDQTILTVMPIRLGKGIPMFADSDQSTKLKLVSTKSYESGVVQLVYDH